MNAIQPFENTVAHYWDLSGGKLFKSAPKWFLLSSGSGADSTSVLTTRALRSENKELSWEITLSTDGTLRLR